MLCGVLVTSLFLSQPFHASAAAFNWGNFYTQIYQSAGLYMKDSLLSQAWDFTKDLVILKMVDTVCSDEGSLSQDAKDTLKSKYYNTDTSTWDSAVVDDTLFTDHFQTVYINNGVIDNSVVNDVLSASKKFLATVETYHTYPTRKAESLPRLMSYQSSEDMAYLNELYDSCTGFVYYRKGSDCGLYCEFVPYTVLRSWGRWYGRTRYFVMDEKKNTYNSSFIWNCTNNDMPCFIYSGSDTDTLVGSAKEWEGMALDLETIADAAAGGYLYTKTGEPVYLFDSVDAYEDFLMGSLPAYQSEYYLNYSSDDNRTYYYDTSYNPVTYSNAYETINNNIVNNTSNDTYYNIVNNYYQANDAEPSDPSGDGSGDGGSGGSGILDLISGIGSVFDLILSVIGNIIELATGIIKQIFDIVTGLLEKVQSGVGSLGTIISDFFPFIPAEIMSCITLGIVLYILVGIIKKITK